MQAIITRYHGPTNTRGSRIVAHCPGGMRYTQSTNSELGIDALHRQAALELARRLGWAGDWVCAHTNDGTVWVNSTRAKASRDEYFNIED